jgi:hypothetical protein
VLEAGVRVGELGISQQLTNLRGGRFGPAVGVTARGPARAPLRCRWRGWRCGGNGLVEDVRSAVVRLLGDAADEGCGSLQRPLDQHAQPLPDALVAGLARLVDAQRLLAGQVQRQVATLHLGVAVELRHHLGGEGDVTADASVEADPGALLLDVDGAAPR